MIEVYSIFAPNSALKYFIIAMLGTLNAVATSSTLKIFVLIPLPRDSYLRVIFGILYL